jgi:hypothetical protein
MICTTTAAASEHGVSLIEQSRGGSYNVIGVLPDGAQDATIEKADGTTIQTPLSTGGGYAVTTETKPTVLAYTNASGSVQRLSLKTGAPIGK